MSKPLLNVIYKIFPHNISVKQFIERKDIMSTLVEMKGVVKKFPGVTALKDISFDIQAGEVHVLLGENGAGKSTLMKILSGVYQPTEGKIIIGGKVGDFLGEYQAGGIIIVLGIGCDGKAPIGSFCGTGMHGGHMYIRSDEAPKGLPVQVSCEVADDSDKADIREYVDEFAKNFGYNTNELLKGRFYKLSPNTASPYKQLYTHN